MSSYFDTWEAYVRHDFTLIESTEQYVINEVNRVTGDKEFPDDLREKIQSCIAIWRYTSPKGKEVSDIIRHSELLARLHSLFHEVAQRRITTRFGTLNDNPASILSRRDAYIEEHFQ